MDSSSYASQLDRKDKGTLTLGKHAMFLLNEAVHCLISVYCQCLHSIHGISELSP